MKKIVLISLLGALIAAGLPAVTFAQDAHATYKITATIDQDHDDTTNDLDGDGVITLEELAVESQIPYGSEGSMAGTLVKSGDSSAVYLIGEDGRRHPFPVGGIFTSWGYNFDDVVTLSSAEMAAYQIGHNVTVRPGTWLVKLQTDPKTYAVEPGGVLRWVPSEEQAADLFGDNWQQHVFDISDAFWSHYSFGEPLAAGEIPTGMWVTDGLATFVMETLGARRLSVAEERTLRIGAAFIKERSITSEISGLLDDSDLHDDLHSF